MLDRLKTMLQDPPPLAVFEISNEWLAAVRRDPKTLEVVARVRQPLAAGLIEASATKPNIPDTEALDAALAAVIAELGEIKRPEAALILPDACARLTVLNFDELPGDAKERQARISERLDKTVPFDIASARISFDARKNGEDWSVLTAAMLEGVVRSYEEAIERAGFWPGWVSLSSVAALPLVSDEGPVMLVKLSGRELTMSALDGGVVRMLRSVTISAPSDASPEQVISEITTDLYPTLVFTRENLDLHLKQILLAGFDELAPTALEILPSDLGCEVDLLRSSEGAVSSADAGIWGYLSKN